MSLSRRVRCRKKGCPGKLDKEKPVVVRMKNGIRPIMFPCDTCDMLHHLDGSSVQNSHGYKAFLLRGKKRIVVWRDRNGNEIYDK
jgi:hypothetical protein